MNARVFQETLNDLLISSKDYDDISYNSLMAIIDLLQVQRASLWHFDDLKSKIECQILLDKDKGALLEVAELREYDFPNYFKALMTGKAIVANDACSDPKTIEFTEVYLIPNGISSMLDVPIFGEEDLVGILCCEHRGVVRTWSEDEINFAFEVAKLLEKF